MELQEFKEIHKKQGGHFFDAGAMRFFDGRILPKVYRNEYFLTSEQFHGSNGYSDTRKYSIRMMLSGGNVETVYQFNSFVSKLYARLSINGLPDQFVNAFELFRNSFNAGNYSDIFTHLIGDTDKESFCGACQFIFDNWEELDFSFVRHIVAEFNKRKEVIA